MPIAKNPGTIKAGSGQAPTLSKPNLALTGPGMAGAPPNIGQPAYYPPDSMSVVPGTPAPKEPVGDTSLNYNMFSSWVLESGPIATAINPGVHVVVTVSPHTIMRHGTRMTVPTDTVTITADGTYYVYYDHALTATFPRLLATTAFPLPHPDDVLLVKIIVTAGITVCNRAYLQNPVADLDRRMDLYVGEVGGTTGDWLNFKPHFKTLFDAVAYANNITKSVTSDTYLCTVESINLGDTINLTTAVTTYSHVVIGGDTPTSVALGLATLAAADLDYTITHDGMNGILCVASGTGVWGFVATSVVGTSVFTATHTIVGGLPYKNIRIMVIGRTNETRTIVFNTDGLIIEGVPHWHLNWLADEFAEITWGQWQNPGAPYTTHLFDLNNCSDLTFRNLAFRSRQKTNGTNFQANVFVNNGTQTDAFGIKAIRGLTIEGCRSNGYINDFVCLDNNQIQTYENIRIRNNMIFIVGRSGVRFVWNNAQPDLQVVDMIIEGNEFFLGALGCGVELHQATLFMDQIVATCMGITIRNNVFSGFDSGIWATADNGTISDNMIQNMADAGILTSGGFEIRNNYLLCVNATSGPGSRNGIRHYTYHRLSGGGPNETYIPGKVLDNVVYLDDFLAVPGGDFGVYVTGSPNEPGPGIVDRGYNAQVRGNYAGYADSTLGPTTNLCSIHVDSKAGRVESNLCHNLEVWGTENYVAGNAVSQMGINFDVEGATPNPLALSPDYAQVVGNTVITNTYLWDNTVASSNHFGAVFVGQQCVLSNNYSNQVYDYVGFLPGFSDTYTCTVAVVNLGDTIRLESTGSGGLNYAHVVIGGDTPASVATALFGLAGGDTDYTITNPSPGVIHCVAITPGLTMAQIVAVATGTSTFNEVHNPNLVGGSSTNLVFTGNFVSGVMNTDLYASAMITGNFFGNLVTLHRASGASIIGNFFNSDVSISIAANLTDLNFIGNTVQSLNIGAATYDLSDVLVADNHLQTAAPSALYVGLSKIHHNLAVGYLGVFGDRNDVDGNNSRSGMIVGGASNVIRGNRVIGDLTVNNAGNNNLVSGNFVTNLRIQCNGANVNGNYTGTDLIFSDGLTNAVVMGNTVTGKITLGSSPANQVHPVVVVGNMVYGTGINPTVAVQVGAGSSIVAHNQAANVFTVVKAAGDVDTENQHNT